MKKKQEATQKEIRLTEEQIKENERQVKNGLNELGKLQTDISASKSKIASTATRITNLNNQISGLETDITTNEKELQRLRDEYLKAVKKMRLTRRGNSALTFIFASENFNQALRRMRYLRQFSEWKDRQSAAIDSKTLQLKTQRESLAKAKNEHNEVLKRQQAEQTALQKQFEKQDVLVAQLKQNGETLKNHLSKKQAEANELKNRIATLIAEEQRRAEEAARKAAEEKARKEAAARKAEEERLAREKALADAAKEKAAKEAAEKEAAEKEAKKPADEKLVAQKDKKDKQAEDKKKQTENKKDKQSGKKDSKASDKKDSKSNNKKGKATETETKADNQNYANARKRQPRDEKSSTVKGSTSGGDMTASFANMRGRLPRPVSGAFRITSRFGRQSLPELPDIVYDNPGIDAEVGEGVSALAVYAGKVSGVYMIPGYNTVVIVNHGNYYTVYGNIASPVVKVGDQVKAGQGLGSLSPDEDNRGHSSIHFEVWRNREKLNPLEWIH